MLPIRTIGGYITQRLKPAISAGGLALLGAGYDVYAYKKEHQQRSWFDALAYGALMYGAWTVAGPAMLAWQLKDIPLAFGNAMARLAVTQPQSQRPREGIGRGFLDSAAKATMRQRAVQALQESRTRANMLLGNEARRISRGYFEL